MFKFKCHSCDEIHEGVPGFSWDHPSHYNDIPENERHDRCQLTSDTCVIDNKWFFVRGCVEIHVHNEDQPMIWGVWVSLSEKSYQRYLELYDDEIREGEPPFFAWLDFLVPGYPDGVNLKTNVYLRNNGRRPYIDLEPTDYPLAVEQREGISTERVAEIYSMIMHNPPVET